VITRSADQLAGGDDDPYTARNRWARSTRTEKKYTEVNPKPWGAFGEVPLDRV
jgi:hypothetical protein